MATLNCHSIIDPKDLDWNEAQQAWGKGKILEESINGESKNCLSTMLSEEKRFYLTLFIKQ